MGRIIAIDYGTKRTGLAVTDPLRIIANVLDTVETKQLEKYLADYFSKNDVDIIVVGKPSQMNGEKSETMRYIEPLVGRLRHNFPDKEIVMYDERFTSVLAQRTIRESGIGKSEAALELVKRGHRLIADDAVEIRKISETSLMGTSPELIRNYVELRGIGIVNVAKLFGMGAVKAENEINLVINIVPWKNDEAYDRLGLEDQYMEILDVKIPMNTIPVTPGRNLAVILEVAAMNNRQRKMGYNPAQEFTEQIDRHFQQNMQK